MVQTEAVAGKYRTLIRPIPKLAVIGNPIPEFFGTMPVWSPSDSGAKCLLAVGRLSKEKGFGGLIKIFSKLAFKYQDWILRIVGEGPDRGVLESMISQLGLVGRVELPGRSTHIEHEFFMAEAFVLTSEFEGFPNVLLEAMAIGLPCVTVDCPSGPREISDQGRAALLVGAGNWTALYDALDILMGSQDLRLQLSRLGSKFVHQKFALPTILQKWEEHLR